MDRTGVVGCDVFDGWSDEGLSDAQGKRTVTLGKESFRRIRSIRRDLGAAGLILPLVTAILPWLTLLAAVGLSIIQLLAIFTVHLPGKEYNVIPANVALLVVAAFIVFWPPDVVCVRISWIRTI